ncbi:MAG TPA: ABC transporter permease [Bryobacteraceae bacterium]|nr:ABC transporter permease [Bryobacteraceae bacterium]
MLNDLRFAIRSLRKSPIFVAVAVLSLGLGIGANTAIFSLLDQILLRLLPVKDPRQLVLLSMRGFHYGSNWGYNAISYPMYHDFSENNTVFSGMFCRFQFRVSLGYGGHTERTAAELVSGTYFPVLGVGAALGRTFTPDDDRIPGGHPLMVLSYAFWKTRFAGDPSILGKTVLMNGHNFTVIGVAQPGFDGVELGYTTQVFIPIMMGGQAVPMSDSFEERLFKNRRQRWVNAFGRLKPGLTVQQAKASLQPFFHSVLEMEVKQAAFNNASNEVRQRFLKNIIDVLPGSQGRSSLRRRLTTPLWVLMALTGGVLLIACANVASLLIARAASRQKEIAIRLAIGAGRFRIGRQLLVESLALSAAGAVLGLVLAAWTDHVLLAALPPDTTSLKLSTTPDLRILGFTCAVAILTGLIFGFVPALQCTRPDVAPTLKDTSGGVVGTGGSLRFRKVLVAAQVTLSLLLLIGAGLFIRSLRNLRDLGPGFASGNLAAFNIDPSLNGYDAPRAKLFYQQLTDSLAALPGVRAVGLASVRILEEDESDSWMTIEGYRPAAAETPDAYMNWISPGYFATLGIPILYGRDFTPKDTQWQQHGGRPNNTVPLVVIVNEKFARKFFGSMDKALGRHVGFGIDPNTKTDMEIVGIVKDIKYTNLREEIPIQMFEPYLATRNVGGMTVYVRTTMEPSQFFAAVRNKVREMDPNLPTWAMRTMQEQVSKSLLIERLVASLSTVFGVLATLLAIIGLYGVMAYTVARRTREIGIRMALGAFQRHVIWMVMHEVLILVCIGIAAGLAGTMALTRFVQTQLFGVTPHDPWTLALAAAGLAAVACAAGYIPALRASRVDAMQALRYE